MVDLEIGLWMVRSGHDTVGVFAGALGVKLMGGHLGSEVGDEVLGFSKAVDNLYPNEVGRILEFVFINGPRHGHQVK